MEWYREKVTLVEGASKDKSRWILWLGKELVAWIETACLERVSGMKASGSEKHTPKFTNNHIISKLGTGLQAQAAMQFQVSVPHARPAEW